MTDFPPPVQRESMPYDVTVVGAGPSGLAAAIRFRQLCAEHDTDYSICVLEKGAEIGAHILSGAVLDPITLNELLPNWQQDGAPITTAVDNDRFVYLSKKRAFKLPTPPSMCNEGNYIISLGKLCRWLGEQAEAAGADLFPGFAAAEILFDEQDTVVGVATGDMGITKQGSQGNNYQPGVELQARYTLFAEGCRGSLTGELEQHYQLRKSCDPQTYGLGIKELWEVNPEHCQTGTVLHTIGWPLDRKTYGGSFVYHLDDNQVAVGFVVGLDYQNPYLSPFEEFQRFKHHPTIKPMLNGGRRIAYGARCLVEGGFQSIPQLVFPGGVLIGDAAGFLNVARIKGTHTAIKSGMLAAEAAFTALQQDQAASLESYSSTLQQSHIWSELKEVRNIRPGFHRGLLAGLTNAALEAYVFRGKAPWTLRNHADHKQLKEARNCLPINYPKADGKISFDRLSSVYLSNTFHEENQPCHLQLRDPGKAITVNFKRYASPEQRYCPAGVYEIIQENGKPALQINAQNCIHCKTCDIKDPTGNIHWTTPEGGGGPGYSAM
ncbi:MAG TPA: electron transfer flavoprotein-ubiquinone oxidoreductase [Gammaproteobacteria bacterium]|nr:electron transfer flavoprotein-ubiquinone oxidoreductase [Gammaproteobacteria bacterium]